MNIRKPLFGLLIMSFLYSGSKTTLDSLQTGLRFFQGKTVDLILQQFQYGQVFNADVQISFYDTSKYLISSEEQDILVVGNIIKTWNKQTDQLIIDVRRPEDKDIFSFFRGDISGFKLINRRSEQEIISFGYTVVDFGYKGELSVDKDYWRLKSLKIEYDQDNWIMIILKNWNFITTRSDVEQFGTNAREVIDLRE